MIGEDRGVARWLLDLNETDDFRGVVRGQAITSVIAVSHSGKRTPSSRARFTAIDSSIAIESFRRLQHAYYRACVHERDVRTDADDVEQHIQAARPTTASDQQMDAPHDTEFPSLP